MKIGIDARVLDRKMTGTGRYLKNLLEGIPKVDNDNEYFVFINNSNLINTDFYKQVKVASSQLPEKIYSSYWLNFILPKESARLGLDVFFTCNIVLPFRSIGKTKMVTVVHDVVHKAHPEFYPLSYRMYLNMLLPITFKRADKILTASSYSKSDIAKYYNSASHKIEVLYTSADQKFKQTIFDENKISTFHKKYNLPQQFLLYVGVIEKRKNIDGLFKIADQLFKANLKIPIVLVGRQGFGYTDLNERIDKSNGRVIYLDYVEEEDLPKLYNLAYIFLFPSFYEGFGIPPLEAMQSGVPVISSGLTSLEEVLDDAAITMHPDNIHGFVDEIKKLVNDKKYYESWKQLGLKRAESFSCIKSAEKLVEIFNKFNI